MIAGSAQLGRQRFWWSAAVGLRRRWGAAAAWRGVVGARFSARACWSGVGRRSRVERCGWVLGWRQYRHS